MAEVVDIVSSGIAIAQLAGSVGAIAIKLNGLWQEVRDVPETIGHIMNHLKILGEIVNEMETTTTGNNNSPFCDSVGGCPSPSPLAVQHCQMACKDLENLVQNLSVDVESSRKRKRLMGKVAAVLKKDTLAKYETRLQSAVQLLTLAHQVYTTSLMMRQPEMVMASVTKALASMPVGATLVVSSSQQGHVEGDEPFDDKQRLTRKSNNWESHDIGVRRVRYRSSHQRDFFGLLAYVYSESEDQTIFPASSQEHRLRMRLPQWLLSKAWELHVSASYSGWITHLRQYAVAPFSPAFQFVQKGSIGELKRLFSHGLATPFILDPMGNSLLHRAALRLRYPDKNHFEFIQWLIELGVDPTLLNDHKLDYTSNVHYVYRSDLVGCPEEMSREEAIHRENTYRYLISTGSYPVDIGRLVIGYEPYWATSGVNVPHDIRTELLGLERHLEVLLGSPDIFRIYVRDYAPALPTWDLSRRLCFVNIRPGLYTEVHPEVLRQLLWGAQGFSTSDFVITTVIDRSPGEISIWSLVASSGAWFTRSHYLCPSGPRPQSIKWRTEMEHRWPLYHALLRDLASICDAAHVCWRSSGSEISTLFWVILGAGNCWSCVRIQTNQRKHFRMMTKAWIKALWSGGIDLKEYGKLESKIFRGFRQGKVNEWYQKEDPVLLRDASKESDRTDRAFPYRIYIWTAT